MLLKDKVAVVTGSGRGIGRGIAVALAREGAKVIINDVGCEVDGRGTADDPAMQVVNEIKKIGSDAAPNYDSVSDFAGAERIIKSAVDTFGRIDILVNNAGVTRRADIMDLTEADWDRIHRVNAKGVFFCLQTVARTMIPRRSGRIINIASIAGKGYVNTSNVAYAASKGAVISLTKTAAQQLGQHDINVNAVCPGIVRTSLYLNMIAEIARKEGVAVEEIERRYADGVPLKRANEPEDIADMVVFLASPGARNITGQCFNVDGGLILD